MVNLGHNNNQFPHEIGNTRRHQTMLVNKPTISQHSKLKWKVKKFQECISYTRTSTGKRGKGVCLTKKRKITVPATFLFRKTQGRFGIYSWSKTGNSGRVPFKTLT